MQNQPNDGLIACFNDFQGAYCARQAKPYLRKLTEFITSTILLILTIGVIGFYCWKYQLQKKLWIVSILTLMSISLLSNILFCIFNHQYWLYALEVFSYKLYFLFIVGYICKAFLLKFRREPKEKVNILAKQVYINEKSKQKTIFYIVFIAFILLYTCIFILSVIKEVHSEDENDSGKSKYCQEIQYLCFDVLCTIMSIIVLVILYKNQKEQTARYEEFTNLASSGKKSEGSLLSDYSVQDKIIDKKFNNPLNRLLKWVLVNVSCQIFGLIQSGLLLSASPPQCLIIKSNESQSNYVSLVFSYLSMYFGIIGTLWYIILVKLINEKSAINRTVLFSQQVKIQGNIELFLPSKEETILNFQE